MIDSFYDRQVALFGEETQEKLSQTKVMVLGCGALGSLVANWLARAGVNLRLVDRDIVGESNLHRTLFRKEDVGRVKVKALKEILRKGTEAELEAHLKDFNRFTWEEIIGDVDLTIDCLDSMMPRYLLNEISVKEDLPFVHGAAIRGEGRVKLFEPEGPCFRCLYPERPNPGTLETCSESGVLNSVTSLVSSLQVNLAVKYLTGFGEVTKDLITVNLKTDSFERTRLKRRGGCEVCVKRNFDMLSGQKELMVNETCEGYNVVPKNANVDLKKISERYDGEMKGPFVTLSTSGNEVILFENGRMQIDVDSKAKAKSVYSKIVGL